MGAAFDLDLPGSGSTTGAKLTAAERAAFQELIQRETGIALNDGKHELIASRISRRLRVLGLDTFSQYYAILSDRDPGGAELRELIDCITTNKTSFFREEHHFDFIRTDVLPRLSRGSRLKVWSAACSSGEEPYSIAMTLREGEGDAARRHEILASDISTRVLRQAELAVYEQNQVADLSRPRLERHFLRGKGRFSGQYRVRPELRSLVHFQRINLVERSWPLQPGIDLIFCRNALIYFDREGQDRMLRRFADLLSTDGFLFLGHSENLTWLADVFERVGQTVYRVRRQRGEPARVPVQATPRAAVAPILAPSRVRSKGHHRRISLGEMAASRSSCEIVTVLGSCVAACLYDPIAHVGGMNHFLLPDGDEASRMPSRYGVHAMELLINAIMREGGDRRRLVGKAFGAAHSPVLGAAGLSVAARNAAFIRQFFALEGIPLLAERLGGEQPLEVHLDTGTGKVRVRALEKTSFTEEIAPPPPPPVQSDDVTLF